MHSCSVFLNTTDTLLGIDGCVLCAVLLLCTLSVHVCAHRRGFKCTYDRGILHLYFNFKRARYRR